MRHTSLRAVVMLTLGAAVATSLTGCILVATQLRYARHRSFFFDPAAYTFHEATLRVRLESEGRWPVAWDEWQRNSRAPLRTVPLLLAAPTLLGQPAGHLATALPALAVCSGLMGWLAYRRSGSMGYAFVCAVALAMLPGVFDVTRGLGPYWLDLPAAYLLGAAALCLISTLETAHLGWWAAFALLASGAALFRSVAAGYALFMCGPVLLCALRRRWCQHRSLASVAAPLALVAGIVGLLAGPVLVAHAAANVTYYAGHGYALSSGVAEAARAALASLVRFHTAPLAATTVAWGGFELLRSCVRKRGAAERLCLLWMAIAQPLLLVLVLRLGAHAQAALYGVPLLFAWAFVPGETSGRKRPGLALAARTATLVLSCVLGVSAAWQAWRIAGRSDPQKTADLELADGLRGQGARLVWVGFFDEYAWIPSLEAWQRFGVLPLTPADPPFFTVHQAYWTAAHPGLGPDAVARVVYERTCRWVDLVVAFDDAAAADPRFDNPFSRTVAREIATAVRADPRWEAVFSVRHPLYGGLSAFRNRSTRGGSPAYQRVLRGQRLD